MEQHKSKHRMSRKIYDLKIKLARRALITYGVLANDGSGIASVEGLFTLLRWLENGELEITQ